MDTPQHLLVPVDLSDASRAGVVAAEQLAARFGGRLTLLHVATASANIGMLLEAENVAAVQAAAEREVARLELELGAFADKMELDRDRIDTVVVDDLVAADAILRWAEKSEPDWICMSTAGTRGWRRFFLGSVAAEVIRRSTWPVLAVRNRGNAEPGLLFDDFRRVLLATDFHDRGERLIEPAVALASPAGGIVPLHVIDAPAPYGLYGTPITIPAEDLEAAKEWTEHALRQYAAAIPDELCEEPRVVIGRPA
ncbi:MAG: universal stress protein, partial [Planctomycetota bacterium]|nr:universal stress protein [Planctomycetota bacterium]